MKNQTNLGGPLIAAVAVLGMILVTGLAMAFIHLVLHLGNL